MSDMTLYLLVLLAYVPGLALVLLSVRFARAPILAFMFLGMLLFNAAGLILVLEQGRAPSGVPLYSDTFIAMLVLQVIIFYFFALGYLWSRRKDPVVAPVERLPSDSLMIPILGVVTLLILAHYRLNVGPFLVSDLVAGDLNANNVGHLREAKSYGLEGYQYYDLGFFGLPSLISCQALVLAQHDERPFMRRIWFLVVVVSMVPTLLLGEKSGVLFRMLFLFAAYAMAKSFNGTNILRSFVRPSVLVVFAISLVPTVLAYQRYYANEVVQSDTRELMTYRLFGVYSETMAATVPLVEQYGLLDGNTLPKVQGLLADPQKHVGMDTLMHFYSTGFRGAAPVPAVAEGYANYGWPGFVGFCILSFGSAVAIQDMLRRAQAGVFALSVSVWFAYYAVKTAMMGLFATLLFPTTWAIMIPLAFFHIARRRVTPPTVLAHPT